MPYDMSKLPPSPYADLTYEEKVAATQALGRAYMPRVKATMAALRAGGAGREADKPKQEAPKVSPAALFRFGWTSAADSLRNNRYRLPAKFYIILWMSMWAAAVGMFVMAFLGAIDEAGARHQGPGPQCGAVPMGPFYLVLIPKMIVAAMTLVTMTLFFFPAVVRP